MIAAAAMTLPQSRAWLLARLAEQAAREWSIDVDGRRFVVARAVGAA